MTPHELAIALWNQGILLVPAFPDKKPATAYAHWRETYPNIDEYFEVWEKWQHLDECHMLTGLSSKEHVVEMFDIDLKNDPMDRIVEDFESVLREYSPDLFAKLYIEQTPSGGRHYGYKTSTVKPKRNIAFFIDQNPKLTFEEELSGVIKYRPVIEVQGANALCRVWPTKGFKVIQGSIESLPVLSDTDIALLEYIGEGFNQKPEEAIIDAPRRERIDGDTPGNDYSNRISAADISALFQKHGWVAKKSRDRILLRRPGAKTKGFDGDIKNNIFMSFSSSVNDFNTNQGYPPFSVYAILEHGGDFKAAAQALKEQGYGVSHELVVGGIKPSNGKAADPSEPTLWDRLASTRVLMSNPPAKLDFELRWREANSGGGMYYNLASVGSNVLIAGEQKARKTSLLTSIIAAGISGEERAGFTLKIDPDAEYVYVDTEQGPLDRFHTARRIVIQSMLKEFPPNVFYYSALDFDVAEKNALLDHIFEKHKNLKVLIIDGIVDFVADYNDQREVKMMGDRLLRMTKNALLFCAIHVNRSAGQANGSLGAFWEKKAAAVIKVTLNDDNTSEVTFPFVRSGERPPAFSFSVVGPNIPVIEGYPKGNYDFSVGNPNWITPTNKYFPPSPRVEPTDDPMPSAALTEEEIALLYSKDPPF